MLISIRNLLEIELHRKDNAEVRLILITEENVNYFCNKNCLVITCLEITSLLSTRGIFWTLSV